MEGMHKLYTQHEFPSYQGREEGGREGVWELFYNFTDIMDNREIMPLSRGQCLIMELGVCILTE